MSTATEKANETLAAYFRGGRFPHALLIEGGDGDSRLAFARAAGAGLLCSADAGECPCGSCRDCVKTEKEIHPDLLIYGGEGGARSFHIDTVRAMRQQAYIRPNEADRKVLLLREVQDMSVQAQNALLKIIEEPPKNVHFLLTCDNKAVLLQTILSRVTAVSLAQSADGGRSGEGDAALILYNACIGSELDALAALSALERDRPALTALLEEMRRTTCELLLRPQLLEDENLRRLAQRAGRLRLLQILAIIEDAASAANLNAGGLLLTTALCAGIRAVFAES